MKTSRHRSSGVRAVAVVTAALALLLCACPTASPAQTTTGPYQRITLDNGLQVIVIENPSVPLATIDITVRTGAFTEPDAFAGLSHLYEHMFFKANAAIPSQEKFMERVRALGVVYNGYTSDEVVTYFFTLPSKQIAEGIKFMADAIRTPLFKEEELVREREVVIGEFDRNEAEPTFVLRYALDSALWMPYVSRKQPLGQRDVILSATGAQMQMIKNLFYVPNNAALIVSGDVKASEIFALAKQYLGGWARGQDPFPAYAAPPFPPLKTQLVVREARLPYVTLQLYYRGPSIGEDNPGSYAATLLTTMVNQATSRLHERLVDSGLAIGASSNYRMAGNTGTIGFFVAAPPDKARAAWDVLKSELEAMAQPGYFTPEEYSTAREIIATREVFEQDNPVQFAIGTTARWWSMASLDTYLAYPQNVATVHEADIIAFVKHYLSGQPRVLGVGADRAVLDTLNFTQEDVE